MSRIGLNAKLYRNAGTYGTPTWTAIDEVHDLTLDDSMGEADVSVRAGGGFELTEATLRKLSLDFDTPNIAANANIIALRVAYETRAKIDFAVMDDAIASSGAHGVRFYGKIFNRNEGQDLDDAQRLEWTIKPTYDSQAPVVMLTA